MSSSHDADQTYAKGDEALNKEEYGVALEYFEEAAKAGSELALFRLGYMYKEGMGVAPDAREAEWYFEKYLRRSECSKEKLFKVGDIYSTMVNADMEKSVSYFIRAAKREHTGAIKRLLSMHSVLLESSVSSLKGPFDLARSVEAEKNYALANEIFICLSNTRSFLASHSVDLGPAFS